MQISQVWKLYAKLETASQNSSKIHVDARQGTNVEHSSRLPISRKNISLHRSDIMRESGRGPPTDSIPFEQTLSSTKRRWQPIAG
jgi:hypothetical protein